MKRKKHRLQPKRPRTHRLIRGATRVKTDRSLHVKGGTAVFECSTYGGCWDYLRKLVEMKAVPYETCMAAMAEEYSIDPPPYAPETCERPYTRPWRKG